MPSSFALHAPSSQPGAAALDLIFIEGFTGQTVIGIHDSELHRPQPLVIDLVAGLPRSRACDTDQIADTIDYGVVRERLQVLMAEHRIKLLEAFAEMVARILVLEFRAHWVRVRVAKPKKFDDVDSVGVQIERSKADFDAPSEAVSLRDRGATVLSLIGAGMVPSLPG